MKNLLDALSIARPSHANNIKPAVLILLGSSLLNTGFAEDLNANTEIFELNLNTQYVATGNYKASYDFLVGSEFKYQVEELDIPGLFVKASISGNVESSDSKLTIYSASIGRQHNLFTVLNRNVFADYSLGLGYHSEEFSTQLIDRKATKTFTNWEYQADAGLGINFTDQLSSRFFINQLGSQGTAVGLNASFKF